MPNLFSTFGRAALVALGLAVAPAAFADADFGNSCPAGSSPILGAGGGQSVTFGGCQVNCGSGYVATVTGSVVTCSAGVPTNVAVSSCTLSQTSPTGSVPAGTAITFTGRCNTGTPAAITTLTWSKTGSGATLGTCASSATVGADFTCVVTAGSGNGSVSFSASNGIGSPATKTANFAVQSGGGGTGDFASCPSGSRTSASLYPRAAAPPGSSTDEIGSLPQGATMSLKMNVTATSGNGGFFGSAIYGGSRYASWTISTQACDFRDPSVDQTSTVLVDVPNSGRKTKYLKGGTSSNIDLYWSYGPAGSTLPPGTYYFNIHMDNCNSDNCHYDSLRFW